MAAQDDAREVAVLRYRLYVDTLQARMPPAQFDLLMEVLRLWAASGGGTVRLRFDGEEKELFTSEVQQELLHLTGLIDAMRPGHEDRADHVVAQLGDGRYVKGAMTLVSPDVAADPDRLRALRQRIDDQQHQRDLDQREIDGIARASDLDPPPTT
ncbi:hypothetical protein [Streptomyces sp. NPDC057702]|uniref:hypothetical protein n=1 Tax=unclassified Streptomyces TaxID=2593676 RepID=UPI0036B5FA92